jgi:hypothetical protein
LDRNSRLKRRSSSRGRRSRRSASEDRSTKRNKVMLSGCKVLIWFSLKCLDLSVICFLCFWQVVKLGILYPHSIWNFILAAYLVSKTAVYAVSSVTSQMLVVITMLFGSTFCLCLCQGTCRLAILSVSSSSMLLYKHTPLSWPAIG